METQIINIPAHLFLKYPILFVYLFGSRVRGDAKEDSDYDFAVYFDPNLDKKACIEFEGKLLADLQTFLQTQKIDMVNLHFVDNEYLKYDIFTQGKVIFEKDINIRIEKTLPLIMRSKDFMERKYSYCIRNVQEHGENYIIAR